MDCVAQSRLKYVHTFKDRQGKTRRYYRRNGRVTPLVGEPGSPEFIASYEAAGVRLMPRPPAERRLRPADFDRCIRQAIWKAAHRDKGRDRECAIDAEWMRQKLAEQDYKCALTGIPFAPERRRDSGWLKNPYAPSLDRIDNAKGYEPGNVRVVLSAVNYALNEWGDAVLLEIAIGMVAHARKEARPRIEEDAL